MSDSDRNKLKLVIDGFVKGNTTQYRIIHTKITQYIYHQNFGTDVDRDEIISEIIEILFNNLRNKKFKGDSLAALNVYIYSIIKHRIVRAIRRRSRLSYTDQPLDYQLDKRPNPSEQAEAKQAVEKIMAGIDDKCRDLLRMKFQEGFSDQEIADKNKKSKNATSTAITRCLQKAQNLKIVKDLM